MDTGKATAGGLLAAMDDVTLLALVGQGDENAMGLVFDRYARPVYSVALRVLRDTSAAEDVLQEVFLQVWRRPEAAVGNRRTLGATLAVAARDRSVDALRRSTPTGKVEPLRLAANIDTASEGGRNDLLKKARAAVEQLSFEQRKTLELAFFDGLTPGEIADTSGETTAAIKSRVRSALLQLRNAVMA